MGARKLKPVARDEVWHCGVIATRIDDDTFWCEGCESCYIHEHRRWFDPKERERSANKQNRCRPLNAWLQLDQPYEKDEVAQTLVAQSRAGGGMSLADVGVALGLSHEGTRILQGGAMRKLRRRLERMPDGARILEWLREIDSRRGGMVWPSTVET